MAKITRFPGSEGEGREILEDQDEILRVMREAQAIAEVLRVAIASNDDCDDTHLVEVTELLCQRLNIIGEVIRAEQTKT
ncbi:MAG: hypothetical protein H6923_01170 [Alphaproteobacteria bacterium]|nr:hypothetical protein [Alphaproteobacteria bacterium]